MSLKTMLIACAVLLFGGHVLAQQTTPEILTPHFSGLMGRTEIRAITPYADGFVVFGKFSGTETMTAPNMLYWDGGAWSGFDLFPGDNVRTSIVYKGDLWVGGPYGGIRDAENKHLSSDYNRFARWNGTEWLVSSQGVAGSPNHFAVWDDRLFSYGVFSQGQQRIYMAEWNGATWEVMPGQPSGEILATAEYDGNLIVSGNFNAIGNESHFRLARYDGAQWHGMNFDRGGFAPNALVEHNGDLYAGGNWQAFDNAGSLMRYDGQQWSTLPTLPYGIVHLESHNGNLYVVYRNEAARPYRPDKVVVYRDGTAIWESDWLDQFVNGLALVDNEMLLAGLFAHYQGDWFSGLAVAGANGLTRFDGDEILRDDAEIRTAAALGSDLYFGGDFVRIGDQYLSNIAHWTGTTLRAMDEGMADPVYHIAVFDDRIVAGGRFISNDSRSAVKIWNGASWSPIPDMPGGTLEVMVADEDYLYLGGDMRSYPHQNLMRWDGSSWDFSLGSPDNRVYGIAFHGENVVVAGEFDQIDGQPANYIGMYENGRWLDLGEQLDGRVRRAFSIDGELHITGDFSMPGQFGLYQAATWNGAQWVAMRGNVSGLILDMTTIGETVFMSGQVLYEGEYAGHYGKWVSRWLDTDWVPIETSINGYIHKMIHYNGGMWMFGKIEYSDGGQLRTENALQFQLLQLPGSFELLRPADGAVVDSLAITLSWSASDRSNTYLVQVSDNPEFAHPRIFSRISEETSIKVLPQLEPGKTYYWRVQGRADAGNTSWRTGTFQTSRLAVNIAEDQPEMPHQLALYPAYPNPFNPTTTLRFELPATGKVRISVYDALGRLVRIAADGDFAAGIHHLTVDASAWASGMYLVRMDAGGMSLTRKMTLVK